mmetsp:Transcript_13365/g.16819  ORF Transcript_13365/g.16819 Transcript_13365/m.16819 type:complete len:425 (-) Transcript_13365:78-1352(-)
MFPYFEFILGFAAFEHVLNMYLDYRQWKLFHTKQVPSPLRSFVSKEEFVKSQEYNLAKSSFGFVSSTVTFIVDFLTLWFGVFPIMWNWSLLAIQLVGLSEQNQIIQSLVFCFISQYSRTLLLMPISLYSTFVIEQKFGFNKQTIGGYFMDHIKGLAIGIVLGAPIAAGLILVIEWGGEYFWLYTWLFVVFVILVMVTIYPTLIAPIFNKFTELEPGELREGIEALATRVKFPLTKLYKVDGSTRSAHSNAYFFGFFKNKRIVLYDTLMEHASTEEIIAIVGHELGHWKLNHTVKNLFITLSHMLVFFYTFGFFLNNDELSQSFGFSTSATLISFTLFSLLYEPVEHIMSLVLNYMSRCYEYQADEYATKLGFDLTSALVAIHKKNASNLNPDHLYSMYHFSHPTLVERIEAIKKTKASLGKKKQ